MLRLVAIFLGLSLLTAIQGFGLDSGASALFAKIVSTISFGIAMTGMVFGGVHHGMN